MTKLLIYLKSVLPRNTFYTLGTWVFGLARVRMIWYLGPRVMHIDEERVEIKIPLNARSRNHLRSMYMGALCVGADVAGGLLAAVQIIEKGLPIDFLFADMEARFLKRPEADVHFHCNDGAKLKALVDKAMESGERHAETLKVIVTVPEQFAAEPVAEFGFTLSVKRRRNP